MHLYDLLVINTMKQHQTAPRRQYVATWIFAILAMISWLSVLKNKWEINVQATTMSVQETNQHSQTFETILQNR